MKEPRHRIGAVTRLTGVSVHALRAWERRYGALAPIRTPAGDRLYSEVDVRRLRLIKRLIEYGHAIGSIAGLRERQLEALLAEHTAPAFTGRADGRHQQAVERFLDALKALDLETAERVLTRAAISREPRDFIANIAQPLLSCIGSRWQSGQLCIASEHAASAMLRTRLGALLADLPVEPGSPTLVSTTLAGERHEFGALFSAIVGALSNWRAIYLGPDLPADEIATAVVQSGACAALISIVSLPPRKAKRELCALASALPRRTLLAVGGSASAAAVHAIDRVDQVEDLVALAELLTVKRWA
jgi:MerR family transcriptional regulator, light-induced transcriptional regulator